MDFDVMELELQGPTEAVSSDKEATRDGGLGLGDATTSDAATEPNEGSTDREPNKGLDDSAVSDAVPVHEVLEAMICAPMQTPILHGGLRLRRSRTPVSTHTLRRSSHLAVKPRVANCKVLIG